MSLLVKYNDVTLRVIYNDVITLNITMSLRVIYNVAIICYIAGF